MTLAFAQRHTVWGEVSKSSAISGLWRPVWAWILFSLVANAVATSTPPDLKRLSGLASTPAPVADRGREGHTAVVVPNLRGARRFPPTVRFGGLEARDR